MATRTWRGDAQAIPQVTTITAALPTGTTYTLTINQKDLTFSGYTTVSDLLEAMYNALISTTSPPPPEFLEVVNGYAAPSLIGTTGAYTALVLTGEGNGRPFTLTGGVAGGSGTITITATTLPSGPEWFDQAENWSGATMPVDGDTLVYEKSGRHCRYGISGTSARLGFAISTIQPAKIIVKASFTGDIGLPEEEGDYHEYRGTRLAIGSSGGATLEIEIGEGEGSGSELLRFDTGTGQTTLTCWNTGNSKQISQGIPTLDWVGTHVSNALYLYKGDVGIGVLEGDTAVFASLAVGSRTSQGDVTLQIGDGVTCGTIYNNGGTIRCEAALPAELKTLAGEVSFVGTGAAADLKILGGTFYYDSNGDFAAIVVSGDATLSFNRDLRPKEGTTPGTTAIDKYSRESKILDHNCVVNQLLVNHHYGVPDGIERGPNTSTLYDAL